MDAATRHKLIEDHISIAESIAVAQWRKAPNSNERDELIALGLLGLMQAIDRWESYCEKNHYDPSEHGYFRTYAIRRIRGSILDQLRKDDWVTRSARDKIKKLRAEGMGTTSITDSELTEKTGIASAELQRLKVAEQGRPVSLDSMDGTYPEEGYITSHDTSLLLNLFADTIKQQPVAVQVVLALSFYEQMTPKQIAVETGLPNDEVLLILNRGVLSVYSQLRTQAQEELHADEPVWHYMNSGFLECCGMSTDNLPENDRITTDWKRVTCG